VLNRLWLEPLPELVSFADRGVQIYRDAPESSVAALTWGMALACYPFFGRVAEIVGRLTALQGECTSAEVHRRMAEVYGEREGTRRMTNMVLQSQADWGAIDRPNKGKQIVRTSPIDLEGSPVLSWLVEACLRHAGRSLSVATIEANPRPAGGTLRRRAAAGGCHRSRAPVPRRPHRRCRDRQACWPRPSSRR
jgi:hypothetical protein